MTSGKRNLFTAKRVRRVSSRLGRAARFSTWRVVLDAVLFAVDQQMSSRTPRLAIRRIRIDRPVLFVEQFDAKFARRFTRFFRLFQRFLRHLFDVGDEPSERLTERIVDGAEQVELPSNRAGGDFVGHLNKNFRSIVLIEDETGRRCACRGHRMI